MKKTINNRNSMRLALIISLIMISSCSKSADSSVMCAEAGSGVVNERVLIFGESWATKGKELPDFPEELSKIHGNAVRACSIGYTGNNTRKQINALNRDWTQEGISNILNGKPTLVIFLTGVNDLIQHRGAKAYATDVEELARSRQFHNAPVAIVEIPNINMYPPLSIASKIKNALQLWWIDGGIAHPITAYRAELRRRGLPLKIIPFEPFSMGYDLDRARYMKDGIHLTPKGFKQYGIYIANAIK